jgi:hypothetical protein
METAEMLLSLSGSNNMTNNATTINGSNNYYKTRCRGLKDEFIKSLRLQKKEKLKNAPSLQKVTGEENADIQTNGMQTYKYPNPSPLSSKDKINGPVNETFVLNCPKCASHFKSSPLLEQHLKAEHNITD